MLTLFILFSYIYTIVQGYLNSFFNVYIMMGLLLTIVCLGIYEKTKNNPIILFVFTSLVLILTYFNPVFGYLLCITLVFSTLYRSYPSLLVSGVILFLVDPPKYIFLYFLSCLIGYLLSENRKTKEAYYNSLDEGRRNIYELESAKTNLNNSQDELIEITELNERNRIARSIHDNLGHKLVGSKMLLEAAHLVREQDPEKSNNLVERVIGELSESVDLLRVTVHDLRPNQEVGMSHIKSIVDRFTFCPINFESSGNLNEISSGLYAVLQLNLKEALTNISKYSTCTEIQINLEISTKFTRFIIKDNGSSIEYLSEGLGLSGMRQRIENIGGTFTVDYEDGFKLYMFFPKK